MKEEFKINWPTLGSQLMAKYNETVKSMGRVTTILTSAREAMTSNANEVWEYRKTQEQILMVLRDLRGACINPIIYEEHGRDYKPNQIEDEDAFMRAITTLKETNNPELRLRQNAKFIGIAHETRQAWKAKVDKMVERVSLTLDRETPEVKAAKEKIARFDFIVKQIDKRKDTLVKMYWAYRGKLFERIKKHDKFVMENGGVQ